MIGSKPILSKSTYNANIERQAFEQKILHNLKTSKSKNSTKLLNEFKDAQDA
jgi:hypothetical protein